VRVFIRKCREVMVRRWWRGGVRVIGLLKISTAFDTDKITPIIILQYKQNKGSSNNLLSK